MLMMLACAWGHGPHSLPPADADDARVCLPCQMMRMMLARFGLYGPQALPADAHDAHSLGPSAREPPPIDGDDVRVSGQRASPADADDARRLWAAESTQLMLMIGSHYWGCGKPNGANQSPLFSHIF